MLMHSRTPTPPPVMNWLTYALLCVLTGGVFGYWVSYQLTKRALVIEPDTFTRQILTYSWIGNLVFPVILLISFLMLGTYALNFDFVFVDLLLCFLARFTWTFALRKSLYQYYARIHQLRFLPNGLLLLLFPVTVMLATLNTIENAETENYSDESIDRFNNMTLIHPALYLLLNVLTFGMYEIVVMTDFTRACKADTDDEKEVVKQLWTLIAIHLVATIGYFIFVDFDADWDNFDRITSIFFMAIGLFWAYKVRWFMRYQFEREYGFEFTINKVLVFFFPMMALLCAARRARRDYTLFDYTRHKDTPAGQDLVP